MSEKTIFLRDPWNDVKNHDSGWGNRLIAWQTACIMNDIMGNQHTIKVLPEEFPELSLVNFPNTEYTTLDKIKAIPIKDSVVQKWIKNRKIILNKELSYTNNFNYGNTVDLCEDFLNKNADIITSVKLKSNILYEKIKSTVQDCIGIHIRRGSGVYLDNQDRFSIPRGYMKYYKLCLECDKVYPFIRDEIYFKVIDEYISKDPTAKFYLGIDVNEKALDYYKARYPDKILTCSDVVNINKNLIDEINFLKPRLQLKNMGYDLIDFFSLSCTKEIVRSPPSTWSYMASRMSGKTVNFMKSEMTLGRIEEEYNNLNYANHNNNEYKLQFISKDNIL